MTPAISTTIVGTQVALILLALIIGIATRKKAVAQAFAWITTALAVIAIAIAGAAAGGAAGANAEVSRFVVYAVIAFIAAAVAWGVVAVVGVRLRAEQERYYAKPETREMLGAELREVLQTEGIALDERLARAEHEREQFLFALEDQHAKQIAGLAQEYQHEASTILRGLVDQIAAEQLMPVVKQQLAEHQVKIERELHAIDTNEADKELSKVRAEHAALVKEMQEAAERIEKLRADNPEKAIEESIKERVNALEAAISERLKEATITVEERTIARAAELEANLARVDEILNQKINEAGNPLVARMGETQAAVEKQLNSWMGVLDTRFAETERILNERVLEQEKSLEQRVAEMEQNIEVRLAKHVEAVEKVLGEHDTQLEKALTDQSVAVGEHFSNERDRLISELTDNGLKIQEQVARELANAEARAQEAVEATQSAWDSFTSELENRFVVIRTESEKNAHQIAEHEHAVLENRMQSLIQNSNVKISEKVDELTREASWQRAQIERSTRETMDILQEQAKDAVADADRVFENLERIGKERVERIKQEAEGALVQSRDYVDQLQQSLSMHLDELRVRSNEVGSEISERLSAITMASQEGATQLEQYARDLVGATSSELTSIGEQVTHELQARVNDEFTAAVKNSIETQQRSAENYLEELAQRTIQSVNGDLAGLAEHARAAVTGELDSIVQNGRQQAQKAQDEAFRQVMNQIARNQSELAEQARSAAGETRRILDEGLRNNRRELEEAMASMGAHMREELVRFHDEGHRRVDTLVHQLREREQEMVREEDRKLTHARQELMRQHQGALEQQVRSMVGGLGSSVDMSSSSRPAGSFTDGIDRPSTPLGGYNS